MDNDAKLLQWARNQYKGLRFRWRYRGLEVMSAADGNAFLARALQEGTPFYAGRCGATEMRTVQEYFAQAGDAATAEQPPAFSQKVGKELSELSGVFPTDNATLANFCRLYISAARSADLLALWDVGAERKVVAGCKPTTRFTTLRALEPYYHAQPWSAVLENKKVLVVHPFAATIAAQYQKRELLFQNPAVLPQFQSLALVQAVQGLGGQSTGYAGWFDALDAMKKAIAKTDFEIALIGAGAYGLPLAAYCASLGRQAVQLGGATQLLFGIKGKRWDEHPVLSALYNEHWVRPAPEDQIQNARAVEGGCYW